MESFQNNPILLRENSSFFMPNSLIFYSGGWYLICNLAFFSYLGNYDEDILTKSPILIRSNISCPKISSNFFYGIQKFLFKSFFSFLFHHSISNTNCFDNKTVSSDFSPGNVNISVQNRSLIVLPTSNNIKISSL